MRLFGFWFRALACHGKGPPTKNQTNSKAEGLREIAASSKARRAEVATQWLVEVPQHGLKGGQL